MFKVKKFYVCHSNYCMGRLWISHEEDTREAIDEYAKQYREEFEDDYKGYYIDLYIDIKLLGIRVKRIVEHIEYWDWGEDIPQSERKIISPLAPRS